MQYEHASKPRAAAGMEPITVNHHAGEGSNAQSLPPPSIEGMAEK